MILSDIKHYLQQHKQATLSDISVHFDRDPDAVRGMLSRWMEKGKVIKMVRTHNCKMDCPACRCGATVEIYAWRI